jgi:hypothetical protein
VADVAAMSDPHKQDRAEAANAAEPADLPGDADGVLNAA